jgi:predicted N-acetyltransferase YhbS
MELVEGGQFTAVQWDELRAGEEHPFGVSGLQWRRTDGFLALRGPDGLVSSAGWAIVEVEAGGHVFDVVGIGAVIVARPHRGRGLMRRVLDAVLERAGELGPEFAMLFCSVANSRRYARFGFHAIAARVTAKQPDGRTVDMGEVTMWRPLRDGATWPEGPVSVLGLPF